MTKDEYITAYLLRAGIPLEWRTENGYRPRGIEKVCVKCECKDERCDGFAMVSLQLYERGGMELA
jgi:hypothetical protein